MNTQQTTGPFFSDHLNIEGRKCDNPTWEDFCALAEMLMSRRPLSFSIQRQTDRDAGMDFDFSDGRFAIYGAEDSVERGTFGFSFLDPTRGSAHLRFANQQLRAYCTTADFEVVLRIARAYFQSGDLERTVDWHVSRKTIGLPLEEIPLDEILRSGDRQHTLNDLLKQLHGLS